MNHIRMPLIIIVAVSVSQGYAKNSFKQNAPSVSDKHKDAKVITKEYNLGDAPHVHICNTQHGSVEVCTQEEQDSVMATVAIKTKKAEQRELVEYVETIKDNALTLTTTLDDDTVKSSVNYELIVPPHTTVTVENKDGDVLVQHVQGKVCAHTTHGNIALNTCANTTVARIDGSGNINACNASGHLKAYTKKGKIVVDKSSRSVLAHTEQGAIVVNAQQVPSRSKINLSSAYGSVTLELPDKVNADLVAKSDRGKITCEHEITLKPRTTTLTSADWKKMKQSVNGTIGSGQSEIRVSSNHNIKIKKHQAA